MAKEFIYNVGDKVSIIVNKQEYFSKILRIGEDGEIIIYNPSSNGANLHMIDDKKYLMVFYINDLMYKAKTMISDVYTEDGIEVYEMELVSEIERYQRREYYRIDYYCDIEFKILEISDESGEMIRHSGDWTKAKLSNISGGGMKFTSKEGIESAKRVFLKFALGEGMSRNLYNCLANVVQISKKDMANTIYEYRVSFSDIEESSRENIVKFVFEEERRKRRRK